ncbi:MAG: DUF3486 family protein [Burkholderiaceae bacterium]|jgi:hypothetical protein|nr:DUF3486 family protein [Burkholderiaceae bacterium]
MARRDSVTQLPKAVRDWLDKALIEENFTGYQLLETILREKGYTISKSAIHRYGQKIEKRFAAIKASTEAARLLTEGAADDQDARSEAVIALVQTELFESIVNLQEAAAEDIDPQERIALLSKAAKNIATLARASVNQKKFRQEVQARAEAAAAAVAKVVKTGGLSDKVADTIRRHILGIVV